MLIILKLKKKLGVDISNGVINSKVALEMAKKGKIFLDVDICVSFTGVAGPSEVENKKVGLCYIAINNKVYKNEFSGGRILIIEQAVNFAIKRLEEIYDFST